MFHEYEVYGHLRDTTNSPAGVSSPDLRPMTPDKALAIHFTMTWVMVKGMLLIAASVIVLSCGTLATLLLVVMNRRVTLRQINFSLAQISEQLKPLQQRQNG